MDRLIVHQEKTKSADKDATVISIVLLWNLYYYSRVKNGEADLVNVYKFKYLGSLFTADGEHKYDVETRCAMAQSRCGDLRAVFNSEHIPLALKLKIYKTAVCSLLTYGSEAWRLDQKTIAMLNGCNARCLSHITQKTAHEEASAKTRTYDVVAAIRQRRHKWLGHILRLKGQRYVKEAVKAQLLLNLPGNITMDSPTFSFDDLTALAQDRTTWRKSLVPHEANSDVQASRLISLKNCNDSKCTIVINPPTTSKLERQNTKTAWGNILKPVGKDKADEKCERKRKEKKAGWSNRQRAN